MFADSLLIFPENREAQAKKRVLRFIHSAQSGRLPARKQQCYPCRRGPDWTRRFLRGELDMDQAATRFGMERESVLQRLFPEGFPTLWCPLITHYAEDGDIDRERMCAHLAHLSPHVGGFLIAGSTGDGWEMDDAEAGALIECATDEIRTLKRKALIGALRYETEAVLRSIADSLARLKRRSGATDDWEAMIQSSVSGFTVCAPHGKEKTQDEIHTALEKVLSLGLPTSLYQLPQITENEISPETVAALAEKYPNFYLFKDTSGKDRVAQAGPSQVLLLRGAEGDYAEHLAPSGGDYDGFLLSTANCFGRELHAIRRDLESGHSARAEAHTRKLTAVVDAAFDLAAKAPHGNAFANANKAMDHFYAYGPRAMETPAPRIREGRRLPEELVRGVGEVLLRHDLMPVKGYLE
jgi:dihydrodipicolinate synthase/N-acetylneuraminate lyase